MEPERIIHDRYPDNPALCDRLIAHSRQVAARALAVADKVAHLAPDRDFIAQAAMLHDIGIGHTDSPGIDCHGSAPYVAHGVIGRDMLDAMGLPRHGLVCERHVGTGISVDDIRRQQLDLPLRDMRPQTIEEVIICYADKFFSKNGRAAAEKPIDVILAGLSRFGQDKVDVFMEWHRRFGGPAAQPAQKNRSV